MKAELPKLDCSTTHSNSVFGQISTQACVSHLEVTLGLHEPPHDPKCAEEVPIGVSCQAGDDGVVWPLVWGHAVGVLLI